MKLWLASCVALLLLCSCNAAPQVVSDAIEAELVQRGYTPEQAAAAAELVKETADGLQPSVPEWLRNAFDIGLLALFPTLAALRNRSRATQLTALKEELSKPKA